MKQPPLFQPLQPIRPRHIALMGQVAAIQHRVLDQSTALGYLWSFLNPLLMLAVLFAFFGRQTGANVPHYGIYLLVGLVVFTHFSKSVAAGMRVLLRMHNLVTTVIFPKDVLVYSALLADLPEFLISLTLTLAIALVSGVAPSFALLALPLIVLVQVLLVLWLSLLLSMLYVFVRDLDHIFEVVMRLLFFVTPIVYRVDALSPALQRIAMLNPLAVVIEDLRMAIIEARAPSVTHVLLLLMGHLAACYAALVVFRRTEPLLLERI
jgi:lipopolysaccharide transport system permease protein